MNYALLLYKVLPGTLHREYYLQQNKFLTFYRRSYPSSVLVDKAGMIRKIYGGFTSDENKAKELIAELKADLIKLME